jgi:hypothetical protein
VIDVGVVFCHRIWYILAFPDSRRLRRLGYDWVKLGLLVTRHLSGIICEMSSEGSLWICMLHGERL